MNRTIETGNDAVQSNEIQPSYLQAQEAMALYKNADQVADFKESLAADTLNNIPHVTEERKAEAQTDIDHVEQSAKFEKEKYAEATALSMRPIATELNQFVDTPVDASNFQNPEPVTPEPAPVVEAPKVEVPTVAQTVQTQPEPEAAETITVKHEEQISSDLTQKVVQDAQKGKNEGLMASVREVADGQGLSDTGADNAVGAVA